MIVRENEHEFIMIKQHDHALISEQIITEFKDEFLPIDEMKPSVFYAIKMHDVGWKYFDQEPFWNDEKHCPYSFIDFPNVVKTVLYKHGIDEVANENLYAALLCSLHYTAFLEKDSTIESRKFIEHEITRQNTIRKKLEVIEELLSFHFQLLKLADNLSLFICLNELGAAEDEIHYFFKQGISLPRDFTSSLGDTLHLKWQDQQTIHCGNPLFQKPFTVSIPMKKVAKDEITKQGLMKSYDEALEESYTVTIL